MLDGDDPKLSHFLAGHMSSQSLLHVAVLDADLDEGFTVHLVPHSLIEGDRDIPGVEVDLLKALFLEMSLQGGDELLSDSPAPVTFSHRHLIEAPSLPFGVEEDAAYDPASVGCQ